MILKTGKELTNKNIEKILSVNTDKMNVMMVKEMLKVLTIGKANMTDSKARTKVLGDLQNVCNIIVHLQKKIATRHGGRCPYSPVPLACGTVRIASES